MGGASVKCKWCGRWFLATCVPLDHLKAKHPEKVEEARNRFNRSMAKVRAAIQHEVDNPECYAEHKCNICGVQDCSQHL